MHFRNFVRKFLKIFENSLKFIENLFSKVFPPNKSWLRQCPHQNGKISNDF